MTESFASSSTLTGATRPSTASPSEIPLRVAVRTLGCKVNQVESETILADLLGRGISHAEEHAADLILINTCTVTGEADRKARKAVRHALGLPGAPVVVVTGCLAAVDADALTALDPRVVVEADKSRVAARVAELIGAHEPAHAGVTRAGEGFHARAMLKVQDGCDNHCTYCIVPAARGLPRAEPLDALVAQATALVEAAVREIVVTGINVGRYRDEATGADLAALLEALAGTGIARLRLSSIEPPDLTERLLGVMSALPAFCPHLHVPLQSGSDRILAAMGRTYDSAGFLQRVAAARAAIPGLALTTDVIAGFPGEDHDDLMATRDLCEQAGFAKMHVFRYSRRAGTPAAQMSGQLDSARIASHAEELRMHSDRLRAAWLDGLEGDTLEVLVERVSDAGVAEGTSAQYAKVRVTLADTPLPADTDTPPSALADTPLPAVGGLLRVRVTGRSGEVLLGRPERSS